jgi:alanine racemase
MKCIQKFIADINKKRENEKKFSLAIYEVNYKNLEENIQKIKAKNPQKKYLLPVKGNGYGTGMIETAHFVEQKKCVDYLGVAHLQEAFELRESGIQTPILILGQTLAAENFLEYIAQNNIEIALSDFDLLKKIQISVSLQNIPEKKIGIHLKIDLGMGRCGILEEKVLQLFSAVLDSSQVMVKGVMVHFPVSDSCDDSDQEFTRWQIQKFRELKSQMKQVFETHASSKKFSGKFDEILFHVANSGAALEYGEQSKDFDMIRPGIASYGYPEPGKISEKMGLTPVVQVYSSFTLIKKFPKDFTIGYGRTYTTKKPEKIAILPMGYADGLPRGLSNRFSVESEDGEFFPSVGRISMDQSAYKLPENISDEEEKKLLQKKIFILGKTNNAKEIANLQSTISYEILINLGNSDRVKKVYIYE